MELMLNLDMSSLKRDMERKLHDQIQDKLHRSLSSHFTRKDQWGQTDGMATTIIHNLIDDFILSNQFKEMVQEAIPKVAEGEIAVALQKILGNRIRKSLFEATAPPPEPDTNWYTVIETEGDEHSENQLKSFQTQNRQKAIDFFRRTPGKYSFILISPTEDEADSLIGEKLDPYLYVI